MSAMQSPPLSFEVLPSFTTPDISNGPEDEVERLMRNARKVDKLSDRFAAIIRSNRIAFSDVFGRQVELIKSRSQAFEDAHITVYDKVLLLLTSNGNDLESPAGVVWYCVEYLGMNPFDQHQRTEQIFHQALSIPLAISQAQESFLSQDQSKRDTLKSPLPLGRSSERSPAKEDPRFAHLWTVYSKAYTDYLTVADKHGYETFEAARFLRDTAENGVHFLKDNYPQDSALIELKNTYNMAKNIVLSLNGGKKRKFDLESEHSAVYRKKVSIARVAEDNQGLFEVRRRKSIKGKEKSRGRGPSGVPYGYTRPVDSYYPA